MPSYLDFNSTKNFRDYILGKNISSPNGPQTFNAGAYDVQKTSDYVVIDSGTVENDRDALLSQTQNGNIFKPLEYTVTEVLDTLPRRINLQLYPYFTGNLNHNIIGIMSTDNYDNESELFKFAANNIRKNPQGPVFARIQQNLYAATVGRARLLDALNGNTATAVNILTGREPLIEFNNKITVAKTIPGKGIDFLQTVAGVEFPFSEIPGDYLSNPRNPINVRPQARNELQAIYQDVTGAIGSLLGIQRRPKLSRKPSDLLIEYMGEGQKQRLYDLISYSKYGPNYTTTARSQNSSKLFNFADQIASGVKSLVGLEAPRAISYIGDDRGNDVKYAMNDFNDRPVRSSFYLSSMFDTVAAGIFHRSKNITEGGPIGGKLTWISTKSKNKLGVHNKEFASEETQYTDSISNRFRFREDSILGVTQEILNTLPTNGLEQHSHVANVIDQTSRIFRDGGISMSRGSNVKYVDKFTGDETGVEYCRVWTKDRSHLNYSDTMKRTGLIRKFDSTVMTTPYNLNIYPNSDGKSDFSQSTNIVKGNGGFYAKKYMFSIENLAWKTSNIPGFTYNDLPYCERGPNGGRVMWFPPYDLKVSEQNSAKWEENTFLGRPEPIYTYQNTSRSGTVSFKIVVDHPSILNLLVREHFKNMSDEEADNYINAFFAGCEDLDFYDLIRKYTTLEQSDIEKIQNYLNYSSDKKTIEKLRTEIDPVKLPNKPDVPSTSTVSGNTNNTGGTPIEKKFTLYFKNDYPKKESGSELDGKIFSEEYKSYIRNSYITELTDGLIKDADGLFNTSHAWGPKSKNDYKVLYNEEISTFPTTAKIAELTGKTVSEINKGFDTLEKNYNDFKTTLGEIKKLLKEKKIQDIEVGVFSSTSFLADDQYNLKLSFRRSSSIIKEVLENLKNDTGAQSITVDWKGANPQASDKQSNVKLDPIDFKKLGYDVPGQIKFINVSNRGEQFSAQTSDSKNVNCHNLEIKSNDKLKRTAPNTFWCREATVGIRYKALPPENPTPTTPPPGEVTPEIPKVNLIPYKEKGKSQPPPLDELKRIVMKTLGECYYFKKLEESSPLAFGSLKEKLKYFHPAFHSTTPEGLNARLTFLNQCVRPGDTVPIKGISDETDLPARNTTFGPPPICILRVGDFYHSKIAIRDVNIQFENSTWDLNPEGIGIQPMIADVTMQVSFIGGHGLEKPVERLQNALSSNFYANTEIYDYRATATEDRRAFNKEELEKFSIPPQSSANLTPQNDPDSPNNVTRGVYIGELVEKDTKLSYDKIINDIFNSTLVYTDGYKRAIMDATKQYGEKITSMFFSPTYREVKEFVVQTDGSPITIEMLGEPKSQSKITSELLRIFRMKLLSKLESTKITDLFDLTTELKNPLTGYTETYLKPIVTEKLTAALVELEGAGFAKKVETPRNELIKNLDRLNFVIETNHDGKISETNVVSGATFDYASSSGFTKTKLYKPIDNCVDFLKKYGPKMLEKIDQSFVISQSATISDADFKEFVGILLRTKKQELLDTLTKKDSVNFNPAVIKIIDKKLTKFFVEPKEVEPKLPKSPERKNTNKVEFTIVNQDYVFPADQKTNLIKIHSGKTKLGDKLNYYSKPK